MVLVMVVLFLSELRIFLDAHTHEHMVVDASINDKLQINLDISFLAINCKGSIYCSHFPFYLTLIMSIRRSYQRHGRCW